MYYFSAMERRCMNSVPGVITLESNLKSFFECVSVKVILSAHSALMLAYLIASSSASRAALNLRALY